MLPANDAGFNYVVGREREQRELLALLGQNDPVTSCIVLTGPSGCGKSVLLSSTFTQLQRLYGQKWILVSCLEGCCSPTHSISANVSSKLLFELIIHSVVSKYIPQSTKTAYRCDGSAAFVEILSDLLRTMKKADPISSVSLVLVLDQAEKLRDSDPLLLPLLVRLGSLVQDNLDLIDNRIDARLVTLLITRSPWEKFSSGTFHLEPVVFAMSSYSRDQMTQILLSLRPPEASELRFNRFVDLLLTVCFPVCRSAGEIIHLMQVNWPAFEEPVVKGLVGPDDEWGQWKLAQPTLKRSLATLYLRPQTSSTSCADGEGIIPATTLELPYFSRFMLIASFLASYNPREADKKFLVKNTGKLSTQRKRREKKTERTNALLQGPRLFPLDRLFAIFHAILRDQAEPTLCTSLLVSQVACLAALGLLSAASPANAIGGLYTTGMFSGSASLNDVDSLANPRYRCLLSFEAAKTIAQSLDFDLPAYLTDFCGV
ncbi:hypothetical protein CRM22_007690 [Opisthorchis felineus]|uniref:Uncharacterized protein n=2 Tax=Opisthorchis felineus TaxID=147828 RepID=A0A4S2LN22_OPIFE|nr:hypothetical protein CRM22_007690 [Opisthorchis felineus]